MKSPKVLWSAIIVLSLFFVLSNLNIRAQSRDVSVLEGNVLGYHNFDTVQVSGMCGMTYPILVRITKVIEGEEKSEYIIVLLSGFDDKYSIEKFGIDKTLNFRLERVKFFDKKLQNLMFSGFKLENEKLAKTQRFIIVSGVEKNSLPLKKILPHYLLSY